MSTSGIFAEKSPRARRHWTYAQLSAEMAETNHPHEIWHGHLIMPPSPSPFHQSVSQRLEEALGRWVDGRKLGFVFHAPLDVVLAPVLTFQPDVFFIAKARRAIVKRCIDGAPDLIIE